MSYKASDDTDDIIESFPRGVKCVICHKGKYQLQISGAVSNGVCSHCQTAVPFQFYSTRYEWLDELEQNQQP